jgi:hypothetical protein
MDLTLGSIYDIINYAIAPGVIAAIIAALGMMGSSGINALGNKKNRESADASADVMQQQLDFAAKMQTNRENQRSFAMGKWRDMLGGQQKYETPKSVGKYVDLMFNLGGELSQIRDPSNKTNIDYNQYKSGIKEYDQLTAGDMSGLDKYLKEMRYNHTSDNPLSGDVNGTGGGSGRRDTGRTNTVDEEGNRVPMNVDYVGPRGSNPRTNQRSEAGRRY